MLAVLVILIRFAKSAHYAPSNVPGHILLRKHSGQKIANETPARTGATSRLFDI